MFFSKKQLWMLIILVHYILPGVLIVGILTFPIINDWTMFLYMFIVGVVIKEIEYAGYWEFTTGIAKNLVSGCFIGAVLVKCLTKHFQFDFSYFPKILESILSIILVCTLVEMIKICKAKTHQKDEIELVFPLENGNYRISDGGDGKQSSLMNYHFKAAVHGNNQTNASMMYAVDIVKLGKWQRSSKLVYKAQNEDYEIFNEPIYAPISGEIVSMQNTIEDNPSFPRKLVYSIGNHVTIKKGDYYVVLGHFRKGSVKVRIGDKINQGDLLGNVGNSGLTPRPHLHMQVSKTTDGNYWTAQGVAITFGGDVPYKNRIFKV